MRLLAYLRGALALSLLLGGVLPLAPRARQTLPPGASRIHLSPRFSPGQTLRYQIDFRTKTASSGSGAVQNPQGATEIELLVSAVVRLEVLEAPGEAPAGPPPAGVRVRATYEKCSAIVRGDSYDPATAALADQYHRLEGKSVEFTMDAQGKVENVEGLSELFGDPKATAALRDWFTQLGAAASLPAEGIAPGQNWSSKRDLADAPLAGTILETQSTYSRNESCTGDPGAGADSEMCAVILTRTEIRQRPSQRNQTPEALRRRGMHSSGKWNSSAQSLSYVSLRTGLAVSTTQSGTEEVDLTLQRPSGDLPFHYAARVRTEIHIALLPEAPKL